MYFKVYFKANLLPTLFLYTLLHWGLLTCNMPFNCMCPVRELGTYVHRAALWRKSDQLFVCYGPPKKGLPATKKTLSRWIVDVIPIAYESSDLPSPLGVRVNSTRSMAAPRPFFPVFPYTTFAMLRDGPLSLRLSGSLTLMPLLAQLFSRPSCALPHYARIRNLSAWALSCPKCFDAP